MSLPTGQKDIDDLWRELVFKVAHTILNNRIVFAHDAQKRVSSQWFLLTVEEEEGIVKSLEKALKMHATVPQQNPDALTHSIFIDVFVGNLNEKKSKNVLLERWVLTLEHKQAKAQHTRNKAAENNKLAMNYRKALVMMRSLYTDVLILPAYKLFRRNIKNRLEEAKLKYIISIEDPTGEQSAFEMGSTSRIQFSPIAISTQTSIKLSVQYRNNFNVEQLKSEPITKRVQIDDDYFSGAKVAPPPSASLMEDAQQQQQRHVEEKPPTGPHRSSKSMPETGYEKILEPLNAQPQPVGRPIPGQHTKGASVIPTLPGVVDQTKVGSQGSNPIRIPNSGDNQPNESRASYGSGDSVMIGQTPPLFAKFAAVPGSSMESQMGYPPMGTSPASPPFPKGFMDHFAMRNLRFSPIIDSPLASYHPRTMSQMFPSGPSSFSESSPLTERNNSIPSAFTAPLQTSSDDQENNDEGSKFAFPPAFIQLREDETEDDNNDELDFDDHDRHGLPFVGGLAGLDMSNDSAEDRVSDLLHELDKAPKRLRSFSDSESNLSASTFSEDLQILQSAKTEMLMGRAVSPEKPS